MTASESNAPVRVALLLPGRLIMYSHGRMVRAFIDQAPAGTAVDVFVCTWSRVGRDSDADVDAEQLRRSFRPTGLRVVNQAYAVPEPIDPDGETGPLTSRCENQWFMVRQSFELMEEYSRESMQSYDYVIRARLDTSVAGFPWTRLLPFLDRECRVPNFRRLSERVLYFAGAPEDENCVWISDQFAVASPDIMRIYCGLYDVMGGLYDDDVMRRVAAMCKSVESPNPRGFWFGPQSHLFLTYHLFRNRVITSNLAGCTVTIHRGEYQGPRPGDEAVGVGQRPRGLLDAFFVEPSGLWEYVPPRTTGAREDAVGPRASAVQKQRSAIHSRPLVRLLSRSPLGRRIVSAARRLLGRRVSGSFARP